jgi:hypothetical protein
MASQDLTRNAQHDDIMYEEFLKGM